MKRKGLEEKACHLGVIGWSSRGGNVEIKRWDNVDSKRERRPLWNTDRAQAPGSATHGADLAARYPEAVLSRPRRTVAADEPRCRRLYYA